MKVTILGNNSALPGFGRHPTAQTVSVHGQLFLIDCGEGTQIQMQRYNIKWSKINHIFISHLHGDHYFGLPGLLNSMSLNGRVAPLHLYAPAELKPILDAIMNVADSVLAYPFFFHPLPEGQDVLVDTTAFTVTCFPVIHRIKCHGFHIETKTRGRKVLPEKCREHEIPVSFYPKLKQGENYISTDGTVVENTEVTEDGPLPRRYAFCADTIYTESFLPIIRNCDAIYHESTYLGADAEKAGARFHSTAEQAALIAKKAKVGSLLLGHFSSKYKDLEPFYTEASAIFPNVIVTEEGTTYDI